jgi:hypothetical protein
MAAMDVALKDALQLDGAIAVAVVDLGSGMALATAGGGRDFDISVAAAANTEVLRAKLALNRDRANLAMARFRLRGIEQNLEV